MKFFNFFRKDKNLKIENLPDLVRRIDKNALTQYKHHKSDIEKSIDPLYMRIKIEEIDYVDKFNKTLPIYKKYILLPILKFIPKNSNYRFMKDIYRPHVELREPHFNVKSRKYNLSFTVKIMLMIFYFYFIGYFWARLKYDIQMRRYMYCYLFSYMMLFESLDYKVNLILDKINEYMPKEMSDKEFEFILYKKFCDYITKSKLEKKVNHIINTNEDIFELDQLMKRINN
jgi:hypothetical protein